MGRIVIVLEQLWSGRPIASLWGSHAAHLSRMLIDLIRYPTSEVSRGVGPIPIFIPTAQAFIWSRGANLAVPGPSAFEADVALSLLLRRQQRLQNGGEGVSRITRLSGQILT